MGGLKGAPVVTIVWSYSELLRIHHGGATSVTGFVFMFGAQELTGSSLSAELLKHGT